ncbi:hypothetical protein QKU48_gp0013 [Fadolivirus algeromassiliense]|uniref:Poly A polymerase head domain-containing protein n=1 Tax=Fadolivirus FV1/VV64 TaxID=3070911 RepID=A0A7D3UTG0_9VIRU|nr:hypothetical protein QKU48_gp0013 [Fadolivirus algeromassiliense]QKF93471.1 hypothetical protein Fadolivirus_1_13 [Fadolivirus FV1/VV64]
MSQIINQILQTDAQYRVEGVRDDVFKLEDLKVDQDWNFDVPTLVKQSSSDYKSRKYINNLNDFKERFYKKYRILKNVDMSNLLIAGGAIRSVLLDQHSKDIDVFVYGIDNPTDATLRVEKLIRDIQSHISKIKNGTYLEEELNKLDSKNDTNKNKFQEEKDNELVKKLKQNKTIYDNYMDTEIVAMYNGSTVTLMIDNLKLQVVLRLYNTLSEIIHGFDLGSSAVGFDGNNVLFTTLSKFCYENMVNIFDGTRRSTTYEYRLIKYFDHGFNIVLPNLDIGKLKTGYFKYQLSEVCEMPHIIFSYSEINGNVVSVKKFYNLKDSSTVNSDYDFYDDYDSKFKVPYFNLTELISGRKKFIYMKEINVNSAHDTNNEDYNDDESDEEFNDNDDDENDNDDDENDNDDISNEEYVETDNNKNNSVNSNSSILSFNETVLRYGFVEWCYNMIFKNMNKKYVNFDNVFKYFNVVDPKKFIQDLYLSNLTKEQRETMLKDVILKQKQWIKTQLEQLANDNKLNWMTENPTTQLTSSFNPIIEDPKLWYGEYYKQ